MRVKYSWRMIDVLKAVPEGRGLFRIYAPPKCRIPDLACCEINCVGLG